MTEIILQGITRAELFEGIKAIVAQEMERRFDTVISTQQVADIMGVSKQTVWKWDRQGKIKRVAPGKNGRYSMNEILKLKK